VTRGRAVESVHLGVVAVVDPAGQPVARCGDATYPIVVRSSVKPFQVLPLLLAGGEETFDLEDADLALACSSHSGTRAHAERARGMLARADLTVAALGCGAHRPFDVGAAAALEGAGELPTPLHNNCSGKHAAMLLGCAAAGLPTDGYLAFDHPYQRRIAEEIAACCGLGDEGLEPAALDGCSAPTFELPACALALGFAALAAPAPERLGAPRATALARVARAMGGHPEMVAGPGRFTTALIAVTGGRVIGKEGAEGVYGLAIRGPLPLGAALKIADGGERARDTAVLELLLQLGALSGEELERLAPFYRPALRNHRGFEVGEVVAELELETLV